MGWFRIDPSALSTLPARTVEGPSFVQPWSSFVAECQPSSQTDGFSFVSTFVRHPYLIFPDRTTYPWFYVSISFFHCVILVRTDILLLEFPLGDYFMTEDQFIDICIFNFDLD